MPERGGRGHVVYLGNGVDKEDRFRWIGSTGWVHWSSCNTGMTHPHWSFPNPFKDWDNKQITDIREITTYYSPMDLAILGMAAIFAPFFLVEAGIPSSVAFYARMASKTAAGGWYYWSEYIGQRTVSKVVSQAAQNALISGAGIAGFISAVGEYLLNQGLSIPAGTIYVTPPTMMEYKDPC